MLEDKIRKSIAIIDEAATALGEENVALAWSGGKDSTSLLYLILETYGRIPFPVFTLDTSLKFPEVTALREQVALAPGLKVTILSNLTALPGLAVARDKLECCGKLKIKPLARGIVEYGWRGVLNAVRWDENGARRDLDYFEEVADPPHYKIQPLLHFTHEDVWSFIRSRKIPYCMLYDQGYTSLGCQPCTTPNGGGSERAGRAQDKELILNQLRDLGYF